MTVFWRIFQALFLHSLRCREWRYVVSGSQETLTPGVKGLLFTCLRCGRTLGVKYRVR